MPIIRDFCWALLFILRLRLFQIYLFDPNIEVRYLTPELENIFQNFNIPFVLLPPHTNGLKMQTD